MAQYNINKIQLPNGDICNIEVDPETLTNAEIDEIIDITSGSVEELFVVDSALSLVSTNPVQNKVITEALTNAVTNLGIEVIRL